MVSPRGKSELSSMEKSINWEVNGEFNNTYTKKAIMKENIPISFINLSLIMILLVGCSSRKANNHNSMNSYDSTFNNQRLKIGLRVLSKDFIVGDTLKHDSITTIIYLSEKSFFDRNKKLVQSKIKKPTYIAKIISISNGKIMTETDLYMSPEKRQVYSPQKKKQIDINVTLSYSYNFFDNENGDAGWGYVFTNGGISKYQADSILHSWRLK
jgi:hypothetical protein